MPNKNEMPLNYREAFIRAKKADEPTNEFDVVMTTEKPARMWDWKRGEVVEEVLLMSGMKTYQADYMPVQDTHSRVSVRDTLGSVSGIKTEGEQMLGRVKIDETETKVISKMNNGHLRNVSIGYDISEVDYIEPGEEKEIDGKTYKADVMAKRITKQWLTYELSLVPVGADPEAQVKEYIKRYVQKGLPMAIEEIKPPVEQPQPGEEKEIVADEEIVEETEKENEKEVELREMKAVQEQIRSITPKGLEDVCELAIIEGKTLEEAREIIKAAFVEKLKPVGTPEPGNLEQAKEITSEQAINILS